MERRRAGVHAGGATRGTLVGIGVRRPRRARRREPRSLRPPGARGSGRAAGAANAARARRCPGSCRRRCAGRRPVGGQARGAAGRGVRGEVARREPHRLSSAVSCVSLSGVRPERPKSTAVTALVASSSAARPLSVSSTRVARGSVGCGCRRTRPSACRRSTMLVTLVGSSSTAHHRGIGSRPSRRSSAAPTPRTRRRLGRAGQGAVHGREQDLLHRITLVTAAIVRDGPIRSSPARPRAGSGRTATSSRDVMAGDASSPAPRCGGQRRRRACGRPASIGRGCHPAWRSRRSAWLGHAEDHVVAFSVAPSGGGSDSVGDAVAEAVRVVRESGCRVRPPRCSPPSRPRRGTRRWRWSSGRSRWWPRVPRG